MEGVILSGMTATSIGPDSNQVLEALAKLKWLVVMDPLPTTSSEFWRRPGVDPKTIQTEVFMVPTTHWIEKDGSLVNSGRWMQWKEAAIPPDGQTRHDQWVLADVFQRVKTMDLTQMRTAVGFGVRYKSPIGPIRVDLGFKVNQRPDEKLTAWFITFGQAF
jgi:formate dehydrogenase major subunit